MSSTSVPSGPSVRTIPEGDDRLRLVCQDCGYIAYENPKIVVGSVATWEDRVLLCRRAIEPGHGLWTLPAGYMEMHETTAEGAAREAWEEARARIEIECLLAVYELPRIGQVQMIFRARLLDPAVEAGPESLEVGLFRWDEIPWDRIAFPTVSWSLNEHRSRLGQTGFPAGGNPTP
ncbi:NUDIX hydrolase [Arenibaculum sp.]|jgi:ADP-ribose pyrophosphatase YjhB (NUDIX family)|uniref:NUDIX hydrolase n=1 Tax=Arenibaculum sp. TaxID=2865862 RepID=UPI002E1345AF|nr:NUDIX hydrolase [Arenibaculum sp.]